MLLWLLYEGDFRAYFTNGKIEVKGRVSELLQSLSDEILASLRDESGAMIFKSSPALDAIIRDQFEPDTAAKLIGKSGLDFIDDDPIVWDESGEPHQVSAGFFLWATEIDWETGTLRSDVIPDYRGREDHLFWDAEEHLSSAIFEDPDFDVSLSGMCFELNAVEMLLPTERIITQSALLVARGDQVGALGRPRKWDWDAAMAHIVALANKPDGLPTGHGAQARIEELLTQWFLDQVDDSPAVSQIRARAQKIVRGLD